MSERMEAFLEKNSGNGATYYSDDQSNDGISFTVQETRLVGGRRRRNERAIISSFASDKTAENATTEISSKAHRSDDDSAPVLQSCDSPPIETFSPNEFFFRERISPERVFGSIDADAIHGTLDANRDFPSSLSLCTDFFSSIERLLPQSQSFSISFLRWAYDLLKSNGSRPIQEMIALKDPDVFLHVRLLALCVRALKMCAQNCHEELPVIFNQEKQRVFLDFLVHQLIDSMYSIFLPSGWAMKTGDRQVIDVLIVLRDALCESVHLLESVCRCLVLSFGCQQWRRSICNGRFYVSSFVPEEWKAFLHSGSSPPKSKGNNNFFISCQL
jgi:hypothetical protein